MNCIYLTVTRKKKKKIEFSFFSTSLEKKKILAAFLRK